MSGARRPTGSARTSSSRPSSSSARVARVTIRIDIRRDGDRAEHHDLEGDLPADGVEGERRTLEGPGDGAVGRRRAASSRSACVGYSCLTLDAVAAVSPPTRAPTPRCVCGHDGRTPAPGGACRAAVDITRHSSP